jgi:hypothetical protein
MTEPLVTVRHLRAAEFCTGGAREWFRRHGLDWNAFLSPGLPAATLEATGDALALRVAGLAREEARDGR